MASLWSSQLAHWNVPWMDFPCDYPVLPYLKSHWYPNFLDYWFINIPLNPIDIVNNDIWNGIWNNNQQFSSCWSHQQCCEGLNASIRVRPSSFLSFCGRSAWGGPKGIKHLEYGKMMKHAVEIFWFFIFVKMVVDFMSICSIHWFTWITWKLKWFQPHLIVLYLYSNHSVSSLKQQKRLVTGDFKVATWSTHDHPEIDPAMKKPWLRSGSLLIYVRG